MKSLDFFLAAEINTALKREGDVSLLLDPGFAGIFSELDFVFIDVFGDKRKFFIEDFHYNSKGASVKFVNFDSDEDVRFLFGKKVYISEDQTSELVNEEFIDNNLIGWDVFFKDKFFGKVTNFENYPGNDVISIEREFDGEILLPFVDEYFGNIDLENKRLDLIKEVEFTDDED